MDKRVSYVKDHFNRIKKLNSGTKRSSFALGKTYQNWFLTGFECLIPVQNWFFSL